MVLFSLSSEKNRGISGIINAFWGVHYKELMYGTLLNPWHRLERLVASNLAYFIVRDVLIQPIFPH